MNTIFRWLNVLLVLLTIGAYICPYIHPATMWQFNFIGTGYSWLLLFNIFFIAYWSVCKKKNFILSLLCLVAGWSHITNFIGFNFNPAQTTTTANLKIATYNINLLRYKHKDPKVDTASEVVDFLCKNDFDILCLQELPKTTHMWFTDSIKRKGNFPYYFTTKKRTLTIFSKYPIEGSGDILTEVYGNGALYVDLNVNGERIRVYNMHLHSSRVTREINQLVEHTKIRDIEEKRVWQDVRKVISNIKNASIERAKQAEILFNHLSEFSGKIILCGDLNETPQSYAYQLFSKKLKSAFKEGGLGLGTTFAGKIPGLKIDFIMTTSNIQVLKTEIKHLKHSDHYPMISYIKY